MFVKCCGELWHSLLKFNLRQINAGDLTNVVITGVELRLFMHDAPGSNRTYGAFSSTNTTWTESSVTYNNFGGAAAFAALPQLVTTTTATTDKVYRFWSGAALTSHVQNAVNAAGASGAVPITLVIKDTATSGDQESKFRTKEMTGTEGALTAADQWPRLIVTYEIAAPLQVSKDADPAITETITWEIGKLVEPEEWHLFTGDTGTSEYTIDVTKRVVTVHSVSGDIVITNPSTNTVPANIQNVTDEVSGGVGLATVSCPGGLPQSLAIGATLTCSYGPLGLPDGSPRTNSATVTATGTVDGGEDSALVNFAGVEATVDGFANVNVTDSFEGDLGSFNETDSVTYNRTFACDEDEEGHSNTAMIDETGQEAEASVSVNCYQLDVEKTVETAFTRTWEWEIEKVRLTGENGDPVEDPDEETVDNNQPFEAHYRVTLEATPNDDEHEVTGNIRVINPNPHRDAEVTVTDSVNGTPASVECPSDTVPADDTLECSYEVSLGTDGSATENTATVTLQNTDYDSAGNGTPSSDSTDFEGSEEVSFSVPDEVVDACVDVSDSEDTGGVLPAEACAEDSPVVFAYLRDIGGFEQCRVEDVENIASFTNNTTPLGQDDHTVILEVVGCGNGDDLGCTLSQGYWKTHSRHGPAPEDTNWGTLADEDFFQSGKTYYEVLWTPPAGGNAYYILAHQYIAAELNILNGADPTDAQVAFLAATGLFNAYTPGTVGGWRGNQGQRPQFIQHAGTLGAYNEGTTGPGACSKDGTEGD
jgi:hypothetical protein